MFHVEQGCDILKDENIIANAFFQMFIILMAMGLFFLLIFAVIRMVLIFSCQNLVRWFKSWTDLLQTSNILLASCTH